jgi:Xaa-Pro aminopeptidase
MSSQGQAAPRTLLIFSESRNGPDMRHAAGVAIHDPFLYAEHEGKRYAVITGFEVPLLLDAGIEARSLEQCGLDAFLTDGLSRAQARVGAYVRGAQELGIESAAVPPSFPLELAERLRAVGISLEVDAELFDGRRRAKTDAQLAGIRKAQRAAEAGIDAASAILAGARIERTQLFSGSELVTSELLKEAIVDAFDRHGAAGEEMIVAHGA